MAVSFSRFKAFGLAAARFPPLTPAVGGLVLILIAIAAQSYVSYITWLEYERRGNWRAEAPLDFSVCGRHQIVFRPIVTRAHGVTFTLLAPLQGDLADYAGKEQWVPAEVARRFLAGREFMLSWQITQGESPVAHAMYRLSDLEVWAMKDHALCRPRSWGNAPQLQAGQEYRLIAEVEQANPTVNELNPFLAVRTWGSLKGRPLTAWRLRHTLIFCAVGSLFLLMACVRWTCDRRRIPRRTAQEQLS
jgi:hypothetical protein